MVNSPIRKQTTEDQFIERMKNQKKEEPAEPAFKDAKEFDRGPLRKSEFYKKLKPTSGKSYAERIKGERQSKNIELGEDHPLTKIIKTEAERMRPEPGFPSDEPAPKPRQETKVTKKPDKPKKPISQRSNLNSQVTPGKWTTK